MAHLEGSDLAGFLKGNLAADDTRRVVRHLLTGCPACRAQLLEAFSPAAYEASIKRGIGAARRLAPRILHDEVRVERGLALLLEKGDWGALTADESRPYQGRWTRAEAQLRQSFELRFSDPKEMLALAQGAAHQADLLAPNAYGKCFLFDLRARAWAEVGNAYRVNENYPQAEVALTMARERWEEGSGDPALRARIDDFEASLRRAQRRFEDALQLLGKVYRSYLRIGDRHLAGRALVNKGYTLQAAGRPNEGISALSQALKLLEPEREPSVVAGAFQNLALALIEAGRVGEAGRVLLESGLRQKLANDPQQIRRVRWVEAKLLEARGRIDDAERIFSEVRAGFRQQGLAYDEALVGLDLAGVWLRQKKDALVQILAEELYATFIEREIHAEAATALKVFEVACRRREATAALAGKIRRILVELRLNPSLRLTFGPISK